MASPIQCRSCSNLLVPGLTRGPLLCPACGAEIPLTYAASPVILNGADADHVAADGAAADGAAADGAAADGADADGAAVQSPDRGGRSARLGIHPGIYAFAVAGALAAVGILVWRPDPFAAPPRAGATAFIQPHSTAGMHFEAGSLDANLAQVARQMRDARADPGDFTLQMLLVRQFQLLAMEWGMTHGRPPYTALAPYLAEADSALSLAKRTPCAAIDLQALKDAAEFESVIESKVSADEPSSVPSSAAREQLPLPGTMITSRKARALAIARLKARAADAIVKGVTELNRLQQTNPHNVYVWRRHAELLIAILGGEVRPAGLSPSPALYHRAVFDLQKAAPLSRSKQGKGLTADTWVLLASFSPGGIKKSAAHAR